MMADEWLREAIDGINGRLDRMHNDYTQCRRDCDGRHDKIDTRVRAVETGVAALGVKIGTIVGFIVIGGKVAFGQIVEWLRG